MDKDQPVNSPYDGQHSIQAVKAALDIYFQDENPPEYISARREMVQQAPRGSGQSWVLDVDHRCKLRCKNASRTGPKEHECGQSRTDDNK